MNAAFFRPSGHRSSRHHAKHALTPPRAITLAMPDLAPPLESAGSVLRGHFLLTSGRHSDIYFEKFRIIEQPEVLSALCAEIAQIYHGRGVEFVAGPTTGGIRSEEHT